MIRLFLRRAGFSLLALLLVSLVLFVLTRAIPGSPARMVLGFDATDAQIQQFDHDNGLDRPVVVQYAVWVSRLALHGDLGKSLVTGLSMNQRVVATLPITLELVVLAFTFAAALSITLGTVSAFYEGTAADHAARVFAVIGVSVPGFWLALLLILLFAVDRSWFPAGGIVPFSAGLSATPELTGFARLLARRVLYRHPQPYDAFEPGRGAGSGLHPHRQGDRAVATAHTACTR